MRRGSGTRARRHNTLAFGLTVQTNRFNAPLLDRILASRDGEHVLSGPGSKPILLHPQLRVVAVSQANTAARAVVAETDGLTQL